MAKLLFAATFLLRVVPDGEAAGADPFLAVPKDRLYYQNVCGISSVSVALYALTGKYVPPAELARDCSIRDKGIAMTDLVAVCARNGLCATPVRTSFSNLLRILESTPSSTAICLMEGEHWVTLCKSKSGEWLMVDYPYKGRVIDKAEFGKHFQRLAVVASLSAPKTGPDGMAVALSGAVWIGGNLSLWVFAFSMTRRKAGEEE